MTRSTFAKLAFPTLLLVTACAGPGVSSSAPATAGGWSHEAIDPVTAPYTFETPLIHTSVRPVAIRHDFRETGFPGGGRLDVYALQIRAALSDRLAVIATKDGYARTRLKGAPDESGWTDVAGGVKYAFVNDPEAGLLVSGGLIYESHAGDHDVLQGNGAGVWRPFVSGLLSTSRVNTIASIGAQVPNSGSRESNSYDWHLHVSPADFGDIVPLIEFNGIYYTSDGRVVPANFEGLDYANLGSTMVRNTHMITGAVGLRFKASETSHIGLAYERPLGGRDGLFGQRLMADWMLRF